VGEKMNPKLWGRISKAYDYVNTTLWASLAAFCVYFAVYVVPNMKAARADAEAKRILEINAEDERLCDSFGIGETVPGHRQCIRRVERFRTLVEKRVLDDVSLDGI
jgi:hypothetical protein